MSKKDVNDYLEKGMYGTPQINPDERRKYLGTFRERVFLIMTIEEMRNKGNLIFFKKELAANPKQQLLLNAAAGLTTQNDYMLAAQKSGCDFKIVDTDNQKEAHAIGLVYATDHAVDIEFITIEEKFPKKLPTSSPNIEPPATKKESWFGKLFK